MGFDRVNQAGAGYSVPMRAIPSEVIGDLTLLTVLDAAARAHGPVRLFAPHSVQEPGLFEHHRGRNAELLDQLLPTLLEEMPRTAHQPRRVALTDEGIRFLIRHHNPDERARRIRAASPLYRERMIRAWKEFASPAETELLKSCVSDLYGDLLEMNPDDAGAFERTKAKELILSWTRADDPLVRDGLARAMVSLGLRQIGTVGEQVSFSGRRHRSKESLFKGDPVEIVEPGWATEDPSGETILQKARVKLLP